MKHMKKILSVLLALVLVMSLVACGGEKTDSSESSASADSNSASESSAPADSASEGEASDAAVNAPAGKLELDEKSLFLITDKGTIDDKSFNQGAWEGLQQLGEEYGVKPNYIQPQDEGDANYKLAIDQAVEAGAKIVVTPGYLFAPVVLQAQEEYPDVYFIAIDFVPDQVAKNTTAVTYKEEQPGFLAGYAAVKDGYTSLGFMGGQAVPAVVRYGFGFVAGANYAAKELGIKIDMKYNYTGYFVEMPEIQAMASSWYQSGTEVVFACGGGIYSSILKAAQENDGKVIGVDVDQKDEGEQIITSAMKNLPLSVYEAAKAAVEGNFPGGESKVLGVESNNVQISEDFSRFNKFTKEEYDAIYKLLAENKDGITDSIPSNTDNVDPSSFQDQMENVKLEYIGQ